MIALSGFPSYGDVVYTDILLNPSRYVGRQAVLRGTFYYKSTERNSFYMKQGNITVEVFCEQLSPAKLSLVFNQRNSSGVPVTVTGTVQRLNDARSSYYIIATDVAILQGRTAAADQRRARQEGASQKPSAFGPAQDGHPPAPISPTARNVGREKSNDPLSGQQADFGARGAAYKGLDRNLAVLLGKVVLLTTIWVGFDARENKITFRQGPYSLRNGALGWVVAGGVLWIAAFP